VLIAKPNLTRLDDGPKQNSTLNLGHSWTWFGPDKQSPICTFFMPNNLGPSRTLFGMKNVIDNLSE
jgi:hypothetical protein